MKGDIKDLIVTRQISSRLTASKTRILNYQSRITLEKTLLAYVINHVNLSES